MRSVHKLLSSAAIAIGIVSPFAGPALAAAPAVTSTYRHVLLISVDGLHAIDLTNWIQNNPASNFAKLASSGIVYPNAFTTAPSESPIDPNIAWPSATPRSRVFPATARTASRFATMKV